MESKTVRRVMAAAHLDAKISRQIAPVTDDIFGCHRFVVNRTFGGLNGYVGGISKILRNHYVIITRVLITPYGLLTLFDPRAQTFVVNVEFSIYFHSQFF